jgi:hypothetical protein
MHVECDTPLKSSQQELQLCFKPLPNWRFEKRVIASQSCRSPTRIVSGLLLGSPRTKSHSDVGAAERHKEYYMGEGGGFPRVLAVVSLMNLKSLVACLNTKGVPEIELTNLLVSLVQF